MTLVKPIILLIGCGPHAKRVYLPAIKKLEKEFDAEVVGVVELAEKEADVKSAVTKYYPSAEFVFVDSFYHDFKKELPTEVSMRLDGFVSLHHVNCVIIATDPLNHIQYAKWALANNLHILMDKPISTYDNVANSIDDAKNILQDYFDLIKEYNSNVAFMINAQRRFLPQFEIVQDIINDVARKYGMPISSMQSTHSDGQWRLPDEMLSIKYHPLMGWGKVSHSGYHFIDMSSKLVKDSFLAAGKTLTDVSVFTKFIKPSGLLKLQSLADLSKLFGKKYSSEKCKSEEEYLEMFKRSNEAELDAFSIISFYIDDIAVSNITLNLMHNGFSRRSWMTPNMQDLYKGNGRLRHEYHNIEQGPLQNIQIHSYQSNDKHDINTESDYILGGNNHYDILIFRNSGLIGGKPLEIITAADIASAYSLDKSKVMNELARHEAVKEFLEVVSKRRSVLSTKGNILDHSLSALLMSLIYQAGIKNQEVCQSFKA